MLKILLDTTLDKPPDPSIIFIHHHIADALSRPDLLVTGLACIDTLILIFLLADSLRRPGDDEYQDLDPIQPRKARPRKKEAPWTPPGS